MTITQNDAIKSKVKIQEKFTGVGIGESFRQPICLGIPIHLKQIGFIVVQKSKCVHSAFIIYT